jgi:hypothetical protein
MGDQWYFAKGDQQQGPVAQETMRRLLSDGSVAPDALVWTEGMDAWRSAREVPALAVNAFPAQPFTPPSSPAAPQPAAAAIPLAGALQAGLTTVDYSQPSGAVQFTPRAAQLLRETGPWVRLFAILMFIGAGFMALGAVFMILGGLVGAAQGGIPILVFGLIYGATAVLYFFLALYLNRFAGGIATLQRFAREDTLEATFAAQKAFWRLLGICVIVGICLSFAMFPIMMIIAALA